jgi:multidrug efflux pump subunit AcrA (membrane-fusion protein)
MIRAGMQAEVLVNYADVEGLILPLSAIVDPVGGDPKIFRFREGEVGEVPVRILAIADGEVAVEPVDTSLSAGDQVITAGHRSLTNGQQVRVAR